MNQILLCLYLLCLAQTHAANNGWSGNGGGSPQDQSNIWFLGSQPIKFCVIRDPQFPNSDAIKLMVKKNSEKWINFYQKYGLDNEFGSIGPLKFPDEQSRKISLQFEPESNCTQVEYFCDSKSSAANSELCHEQLQDKVLFLLGKPNIVIKNYLQNNGDVSAVALRTDYNHKTYRSGGIIWISEQYASSWSRTAHMMLHEMGHILGMKHDSCWIMASNVNELLNNWLGIGAIEQIEAPNWPYSFKEQDLIYFTDQKFKINDEISGYLSNWTLQGLTGLLGFDIKNYFQVRGTILKVQNQWLQIKIEIEEYPTGKLHTLIGQFQALNYSNGKTQQPQLFTDWKSSYQSNGSNISQITKSTYFLENGWVSNQLVGVLNWNGQNVAATLKREKGLSLGLLFPGEKNWLILETLHR